MSEETEQLLEDAMAPPPMLVAFRIVAARKAFPDWCRPSCEMAEALLRDKPSQFRMEWRSEEKAWREAFARLQGKEGGKPAATMVVPDEGSHRAGELLERLLGEIGEESK